MMLVITEYTNKDTAVQALNWLNSILGISSDVKAYIKTDSKIYPGLEGETGVYSITIDMEATDNVEFSTFHILLQAMRDIIQKEY